MSNKIVKLYGLKHSGSHYLDWLLKHNTEEVVVLHNQTGWNHGIIQLKFHWDVTKWNTDPLFEMDEKYDSHIKSLELTRGYPVTHYKDEIESLYFDRKLPLLILIRNPYSWIHSYCVKHKEEAGGATFEDAAAQWNSINLNYIKEQYFPKLFIKFENLQQNPQEELKRVSNFLGVELNEEFKDSKTDMVSLANEGDELYTDTSDFSLKNEVDKWLNKDVLNFYNSL